VALCASPASVNAGTKWKRYLPDVELQNSEQFPKVFAPVHVFVFTNAARGPLGMRYPNVRFSDKGLWLTCQDVWQWQERSSCL